MKRLHRAQYELGRWSIQTAGANAYATTTLQTALLIRQIGGPRASRLLLCVMPAERTLMHAQMRHCVSPRSCSWHPPWTNKTAISVPQHAKFSLRDYRPHPARDEFTPLNSCSHLENSSDLGHLPGRPQTPGGRSWCPPGPTVRGPSIGYALGGTRARVKERKKENGQPKGGMGGRHAATTQGF